LTEFLLFSIVRCAKQWPCKECGSSWYGMHEERGNARGDHWDDSAGE
jgi:hypothetical protein